MPLAAATGVVLAVLLIGAVLATGQTFPQRCNRAFPDNVARAELCVFNLGRGNPP